MNVRERRRKVADVLKRQIPADFYLAVEPDHPFLMKGPDLMVAGRGMLWAVFVISGAEQRSANVLHIRLALSKLALPEHAVFILALTEWSDDIRAAEFASVFDYTIMRSSLDSIWSLMTFVQRPEATAPLFSRRLMEQRFSLNYRLSSTFARAERHRAEPIWAERRGQHTARVTERFNVGGAEVRRYAGRPSLSQIDSLIREEARQRYDFANGQPIVNDLPPRIALVEELPSLQGDPDKPIRAAAFADVAFIPASQESRLGWVAKILTSRTRFS